MFKQLPLVTLRRLGGEFLTVAVGQVVAVIGTFVGIRILTSILPVYEYGRVALLFSLVSLVSLSMGRASGLASSRFYGVSLDRGELSVLRSVTFHWYKRFLFACIFSLLFLLLIRFVFRWELSVVFLVEGIVLACFLLFHAIGTGFENAARHRCVAAFHLIGYEWGRTLFSLMFLLWISKTAEMAVAGFIFATVLVCITHVFFMKMVLFAQVTPRDGVQHTSFVGQYYSGYFIPVLISGIFTWVYLFSARWILAWFGSLEDVAVYSAFYQVGVAPSILGTTVLISLLTPVFYRRVSDESDLEVHRQVFLYNLYIAVVMLLLVLLGSLLVACLEEFICRFILHEVYRPFSWMLPFLVLAGGLYATGEQLLISVMSGKSPKILVPMKAGMAFLAMGLYWSGCHFAGVEGIVFSSVFLGGVYLLWVGYLWLRLYKKKFRI